MIDAQNKITSLVDKYRLLHPEEYAFVVKQIRNNRENLKNKFAETGMDTVERALTEVPETLFEMFLKGLSEDELAYYSSKEGTRWFAKSFREFVVGSKI